MRTSPPNPSSSSLGKHGRALSQEVGGLTPVADNSVFSYRATGYPCSMRVFCFVWVHCFVGFNKDSIPKLVLDYKSGKINLDEFVTHNMPLDKVNDAIELMKTGKWYLHCWCISTVSLQYLE